MQQAFRLQCKKQTVHTTVMIWHYGSANHPNKTVIGSPQCQILHYTFTVCSLPKILKLCKFVTTVFTTWQKPNQLFASMSLSWFHLKYVGFLKKPKQSSGSYMPTIPQLLAMVDYIQVSFVIHNNV